MIVALVSSGALPTMVSATVTPATDAIQVPAGGSVDHVISVDVPAVPPKADILIAIDTTGSMGASIAQAKADAISIVTGVQGSVSDTQFAVVGFKDSSDGSNEYQVVRAMTSTSADVQTAVNSLSAGGGGDLPEAHNLVFHNSYTPATGGAIGWRSGTKKIVVVISDAQPHGAGVSALGLTGCTDTGADPHGYNTATELAGMAAADRTLFMVRQASTASIGLACYQSIVGRTHGSAVDGGTALGSQIVTLINGAFNGLTEVHMEVASAAPSPAVPGWISFAPPSIAAAGTPSTQQFTAHVAVPTGTAPGTYTFDLKAVAGGADIGHQTLSVVVPTTHLSDAPILVRAVAGAGGGIAGRLHSTPNTSQDVSFYYNATCDPSGTGAVRIWAVRIALDAAGDAPFVVGIDGLPASGFVTATASAGGATSDPSPCIALSPGNDSWPNALDISTTGGNATQSGAPGYVLDSPGQSRWYKFAVTPGTQVQIDLSNLPADYDLVLFKDISKAYNALTTPSDLNKLSAEFAGQAFTGQAFTGQAFTGQAFTGQAFTADSFSGQAFTGQAFTGQAFTGQAFTGQAFTGSASAGQAFTAQAFTSAQTRSGLAVSAGTGLGPESITVNSWNESGYFYVRVTGRDGAFDPSHAFSLHVNQTGTSCDGVHPIGSAPAAAADTGVKTVILTDSSRIAGSVDEGAALATRLDEFAARPEVAGVVVDVAGNQRIQDLNAQADANYACPYAKNLVANALKDVVDSYRTNNHDLAYVVLVGGDSTIPFFRYADQAGLAPESGYVPPVASTSPSEASLRENYTLSQDAYGAGTQISQGANAFPVPDLAVGRLVENAGDATGMLDAYLGTASGVVATPTSSLVTGYDFLADSAQAVQTDLVAGIGTGGTSDTLISPNNTPPANGWTATQLKDAFLGTRHDITFLAGHFSAKSALAADFSSTMTTADLAASSVDLKNAIIFSAGCHSGYNIVDADGVPAFTDVLDWSQAFAEKQATFIGGTGYQYGDTDFVMYSEQIYSSFAHQLRMGSGPVSVGQALVRAKQDYLRGTTSLQGIDQKALLEATLFGLPMLSVDLPIGRIPTSTDATTVSATAVTGGPGATLGLQSASIDVTGTLTPVTKTLQGSDTGQVEATYYEGPDGVSSKPYEPTLPLISKNVDVPGVTLRGVGFVGGAYQESSVVPLSGAATTEFGVAHTPFSSPTFYPTHLATPNYFDALGGGDTRLMVTPAQHKSNGTADFRSTLRLYSDVNLKLFYSSNIDSHGGLSPALAAAPGIYDVSASETTPGTITVKAHVVGDPSAGIQETWVTWTGFDHAWHSVDLVQDTTDSTLWTGTIGVPGGGQASDVQFMLQAVNGVGLVGLHDNYGRYFTVAPATVTTLNTTHVALAGTTPTQGVLGATVDFSATLTGASRVDGQPVVFSLGNVSQIGTTDGSGVATVHFSLTPAPADYSLGASYAGDSANATSSDVRPFTVLTRTPSLTFDLSGLPAQTFGGLPFSVAGYASTNSDGVVTFGLGSGSLGCTVTSTGVVTLTGATSVQNLCTIEASVSASARWDSAGPITQPFSIGQSASVVTMTCPSLPVSYTGSALTPCTATATGAGLATPIDVTGLIVYSSNTDVGAAAANVSWPGDIDHAPSSGSGSFSIGKAPSIVAVTCPSSPVMYTGSALTPCSVTVSGAGGLQLTPPPIYSNNVAAGTAGASYSYLGDFNHNPSTGSGSFSIGKASQTITFTSAAPSAAVFGVGNYVPTASGGGSGLPVTFLASGACTGTTTITFTGVGTCTVTGNQAGNTNYNAALAATQTFQVRKQASLGYTGNLFWSAGTGTSTNVTFTGQVTAASSPSVSLTNASVDFLIFASGNATTTPDFTCHATSVSTAGVATCTRSLTLDNWTVIMQITPGSPYFTAPNSDPVVVTVYQSSSSRYAIGAGWIVDPSYLNKPVAVSSTNKNGYFGFAVSYKSNGKTPQGQAEYVFRGADGYNYVIKSTSWTGGGLSFATGTASFSGKASVTVINPANGRVVSGLGGTSFTYRVDVKDGSPDKFAISVYTSTGALYHQAGTTASPISLGAGQIIVH